MSTSTSLFPDVNVWLALVHEIHPHHAAAKRWSSSIEQDSDVYFCRFTQLGLLRLLTNISAMGADVLTQAEAWSEFDQLVAHPGNRMIDEPKGLASLFREFTTSNQAATKQWADGYLAAFADAAGIRLVTFDRALAARAQSAELLG